MGSKPAKATYWEQTSFYRHRDVVVIGAGIVGISTALQIRKMHPDWSIVVIDRHPSTLGASTRNAGFACTGSPSELAFDLKSSGLEALSTLVKMRWDGLHLLRRWVGDVQMDYAKLGGYEVFRPQDREAYEISMQALPLLNREFSFGGSTAFREGQEDDLIRLGLDRGFSKIIHCHYEASIHPGKMMHRLHKMAILDDVEMLLGLEVSHIGSDPSKAWIRLENEVMISAASVVVATNALASELLPSVPVKPVHNQIMMTSEIPSLRIEGNFHYDRGYIYFRNVGKRLLIGGARNRFPEVHSSLFSVSSPISEHLYQMLREDILPEQHFDVQDQWSGVLGVWDDTKTPIVQWHQDRILLACRMGGMGVAIGAIIGKKAALKIDQG